LQNLFTENDGTVRFPISATGPWMVSSVKMIASEKEGAEYHSLWASLVFGIFMGKFSFWNMRQIKFFWLLGILVFFCEESDAQEIYFDKAGNRTNEKGKSFFYQRKMVDTLSLRDTVFLVYSENDALFGREIYNKGKLNGPFTYYYKDGRVKERGSYAENQKVDYNFNYYESGNPKSTLYYPKKQRQVSDFKEYDFLIINYWNEEGKQIINNGNGSCNCRFDYLRANPVTSTNPKNYSTLFFEEAYYDDDNPEGGKASYREIGKVIDGLRDSVCRWLEGLSLVRIRWCRFFVTQRDLHKWNFQNGREL